MNEYEMKQAEKKERYTELAEKAFAKSESSWKAAKTAVDGIPFGQPILVGHHSERRHRAALKRYDNAMRRAHDEHEKAKTDGI